MDKISEITKKLHKENFGRNLFLFVMGMLLSAVAFNLFFSPYNINSGGSGGLAIILHKFFGLDKSFLIFIICLTLLIIALVFFGYDYAFKMLLITFLYPCFVASTTLITKYINLDGTSIFLMMIIGGAMLGLSSGLIRKSGYNPGGFAVLYDLMYKYLHISIGLASGIVNGILLLVSNLVFGLHSALYAIIALLVQAYIVDKVIIGISDNKVFYIVTKKPYEVKDYVIDKLHYSVTIVDAKSGESNKKRKLLMCVVPTIEYVKLREVIREIDHDAFFLIVDTYETSIKRNGKIM